MHIGTKYEGGLGSMGFEQNFNVVLYSFVFYKIFTENFVKIYLPALYQTQNPLIPLFASMVTNEDNLFE